MDAKVVDANDLHLLARLPTEGWLLYCLYIPYICIYIYINIKKDKKGVRGLRLDR